MLLLESDTLGSGASSRAAGMVRAQGGTETAVRLGLRSREFYRAQRDLLGIDSGFVPQGYFMPCFSAGEVDQAQRRIAMQRALGLDVSWCGPEEVDAKNPALAPGRTHGASYAPGDGYIDPPRNVLAYTTALVTSGVEIHEHTAFTRLRTKDDRVVGIESTAGPVDTEHVVLTGGPRLADVGSTAGVRIPVGAARHQVVVTEPHAELAADRVPMVFDVTSGIYWRPHEGGLLWGMSNPDERPGEAATFDWAYYRQMQQRITELLPRVAGLGLRKAWAATIDYTPDHLPILGPARTDAGPVAGSVVAAAGGHGMMWGPAIAEAAADLVLHGRTDVVDITDLGLDRFDAEGHSRLAADPIALPFPEAAPPVSVDR